MLTLGASRGRQHGRHDMLQARSLRGVDPCPHEAGRPALPHTRTRLDHPQTSAHTPASTRRPHTQPSHLRLPPARTCASHHDLSSWWKGTHVTQSRGTRTVPDRRGAAKARAGCRAAQGRQDFHSARGVPHTAHGRAHPLRTTSARVVSRAVVSGRAAAFAEGGRRYKQARVLACYEQARVQSSRKAQSSACWRVTSRCGCSHLAQGTVKRACGSFQLKAQSSRARQSQARAADALIRCAVKRSGGARREVRRCA